MCLVALAVERSARFPFVVAANRDEFFARPAAPLGWWSPGAGAPDILGGRDLQGGGTWLGLSAAGRFALLTNVRDPARHAAAAPSRGEIVPRWLRGDMDAAALQAQVASRGYNGFNVIAADLSRGEVFHASDRTGARTMLSSGVHGLSNAGLDTPWPKVLALKSRLAAALVDANSLDALSDALFDALADPTRAPDDEVPSTGVPADWERALSAAFVALPERGYGTRCSTLVITEWGPRGSMTHVFERSFDTGSRARAADRHVVLSDWPPQTALQSDRDMSTCAIPASSYGAPPSTKPARR
jgi:uncharacterized protein with NRDE domain